MKPSEQHGPVFQENKLSGVDVARRGERAEGEEGEEEGEERTPDVVEEQIGYDELGTVSTHTVRTAGERRPVSAADESGSDERYEAEPSQTPEELAVEFLIEATEAPPVQESPRQRKSAAE